MSEITVDYTQSLDHLEQLGALSVKIKGLSDGSVSDYPAITARFGTLLSQFHCDTIAQLKGLVVSDIDTSVHTALKTLVASQLSVTASIRAAIAGNDGSVEALPKPHPAYHKPRSVVEQPAPDLLYLLLLRPSNQTLFGSIDSNVTQLLKDLATNLGIFNHALGRVTPQSTPQVLAEIKFEIEALIDSPPENILRSWLSASSVVSGGRSHKRIVALADLSAKQAELVRNNDWYPNLVDLLSKLPESNRLFGKHDPELQYALNAVEHRLRDLEFNPCKSVPAYIAQLVSEYGYLVAECVTSIHALVSIRSLLIKKFNEVKQPS